MALALLAVQTAAQMHLIGHAADIPRGAAGTGQAAMAGLPDDDTGGDHAAAACLECLALSGIDLPLGAAPTVKAPGAAARQPLHTDTPPSPDGPLPRPRCRAPPGLFLFTFSV